MPVYRMIFGAAALALFAGARHAPPPKPAPPLPALAPDALVAARALQPGLWQLLVSDSGHTVPREICLGDTRQLLQLRHGATPCGALIVANDAKVATVQYSCPGAGWGRTSLRPETAVKLHLDSQGIADNAPFSITAEGRRIADCAPAQPAAVPAAPAAPPPPGR